MGGGPEAVTRAKAPNFIGQPLSGFENPLPRTQVRGYTVTRVSGGLFRLVEAPDSSPGLDRDQSLRGLFRRTINETAIGGLVEAPD
jgi:hypothetical protein